MVKGLRADAAEVWSVKPRAKSQEPRSHGATEPKEHGGRPKEGAASHALIRLQLYTLSHHSHHLDLDSKSLFLSPAPFFFFFARRENPGMAKNS
jgi:hypothetical protein